MPGQCLFVYFLVFYAISMGMKAFGFLGVRMNRETRVGLRCGVVFCSSAGEQIYMLFGDEEECENRGAYMINEII